MAIFDLFLKISVKEKRMETTQTRVTPQGTLAALGRGLSRDLVHRDFCGMQRKRSATGRVT